MQIYALFSFLFASALAATFAIKDLVMTHGLQTAAFEDRLAVVVDDAVQDEQNQTRYPVIFWMGFDNPVGPFSAPKTIKPENLVIFDGDQRGYNPESKFDSSNRDHILKANAYMKVMVDALSALNDSSHTQGMKHTLIIGIILKELGHPAMLHVIADLGRRLQ